MRCVVPGCERDIAVKKHRLCGPHARRLYRTGHPGNGAIRKVRTLAPFKLKGSKP